jgi:hypothetical protein
MWGGAMPCQGSWEYFTYFDLLRVTYFGDSQLCSEVGDLQSAMKMAIPLVVSFDRTFLLTGERGHARCLPVTRRFY